MAELSYGKFMAGIVTSHLPNASHSAPSSTARAWYAYGDGPGETACIIASRALLEDCEDRSYAFMILRWCSVVVGRMVDTYLSNAFLLIWLPLFTGLGIGYYLGNRNRSVDIPKNHTTSITSQNDGVDGKKISYWDYFKTASSFASLSLLAAWWCRFSSDVDDAQMKIVQKDTDATTDTTFDAIDENEEVRDENTRTYLKSSIHEQRESGIDPDMLPKHIAVIMDGNRRYGRAKFGSASRGHWSGSKTLVDFSKWCLAEGIQIVTVYAFSTENWNRSASEVSTLMNIFCKYCDELRVEALERGICLKVLSTETDKIPPDVAEGIRKMVEETKHCNKLTLNICLSYGSRGEIVNACKSIAADVRDGNIDVSDISDVVVGSKMLTYTSDSNDGATCTTTNNHSDPDLIIRTSGEYRLSNFLLWQLAYSEMFFLKKQWPELTKADLLDIIRTYAGGRQRRYGK